MTYNDIIEYGKRIFNVDLTIESDPIFGNRLISKVDLPDVYANPWINPNDYELSNSEKQWTAPASAIIARRLKVYGGSTSVADKDDEKDENKEDD